MQTFDDWLAERGPEIAALIDTHADTLCEHVSTRLASSFPTLCYDPARLDAAAFQLQTFRETPRRLHRLLQVVLLCQSPTVIEREYRWGWQLLTRYQVERKHFLAHIRWYFEELFATVPLSSDDKLQIVEMRDKILHMVENVTIAAPQVTDQARRRQRLNGHTPIGRKEH